LTPAHRFGARHRERRPTDMFFLPLRDNIQPERPPVVNWLLIVANVAAFVWMVHVCPTPVESKLFAEQFGLVPDRVLTLVGRPRLLIEAPGPVLRDAVLPFASYMFVHGGILHLLGNLWFLLIFGNNVEGRLGARRYLVFYFVCGILAGALHVAATPHAWTGPALKGFASPLEVPMVGASGAIAGVLGAYAVWFPRARLSTLFLIFVIPMPAILFIGIWFAGQYLAASNSLFDTAQTVSVAYWAHVGGFVTGAALALIRPRRPAK
jgi:membrane associated rhomboid family serine protease